MSILSILWYCHGKAYSHDCNALNFGALYLGHSQLIFGMADRTILFFKRKAYTSKKIFLARKLELFQGIR